MNNLDNQKTLDANNVFGKHFLNSKSLFQYHFNTLPCVHFINDIAGEKVNKAFKEVFAHLIVESINTDGMRRSESVIISMKRSASCAIIAW